MSKPIHLLVIEDSEDDTLLVVSEFKNNGYDAIFERVDSPDTLVAALEKSEWDVVIADHAMPKFDSIRALELFQARGLDIPFIVVSGKIGEEIVVEALKAGANDYIMKDNLLRLVPAVEREIREARLRKERKKIKSELRQSQKLESIGRLAGGISHDFNNILTAIGGYAELTAKDLGPKHPRYSTVMEIQKATKRASALTRQLLTFSQRQRFLPQVLDLNTVAANFENMLQRVLGEDIELVTKLEAGSDRVEADQLGIEQILLNLAVNAREAMPDGGKLTIRTANVQIDEEFARTHPGLRPGPYVLISASDSGIGMDKETKSHLFEPFFTTKDGGTGLGLSTIYGIVLQSKGHIMVESWAGQGSTFTIFVPHCDKRPPRNTELITMPSDALQGSETVLVVDDEEAVRAMLAEALATNGYKTVQAANGMEAIQIFEKHLDQVDLVITDVVMPGISGPELKTKLVEKRPDIKVLYISGYPDRAVGEGLLGAGVYFLQKPFSLERLARKVRETLDARSQTGVPEK